MEMFVSLITKLLPLYLLIFLGYLFGKLFKIKKEIFASLLFYIIIPVVIITSVAITPLTIGTLIIPLLFFLFTSLISLLSLWLAGFLWKDGTKNILAYISGSANTGYFGLPVAVTLFGNSAAGIVSLAVLGTALYSNSFGFFLAARGKYSIKDSLIKIARLPMFYAFFLGVLANIFHINFQTSYHSLISFFTGAFTIVGMMLIGIAISEMKTFAFDYLFTGFTLFAKFLIWPVAMFGFIFIDQHFFHLFNNFIYHVFIIMAIVPAAANMVTYATILKLYPEKVSMAILVSTLFASIYIPIFVFLFLS